MQLRILSGGAAQGLVAALRGAVQGRTGCEIDGTFGAVGAMRDKLLAGAPADLLILTAALIAELARCKAMSWRAPPPISASCARPWRCAAANRCPPVGDAAALRAALLAADAIYFPDPKLATAGIHFAKVLERLGIAADVAARLDPIPTAPRPCARWPAARGGRPIGCTQVTEILSTPGVTLVGPCRRSSSWRPSTRPAFARAPRCRTQARRLAALLAGDTARDMRERVGLEFLF